jgi:hypothetical protein
METTEAKHTKKRKAEDALTDIAEGVDSIPEAESSGSHALAEKAGAEQKEAKR